MGGPQDAEIPSPDGAFLLRADVAPAPNLFGGAQATLTLRHHDRGEPVQIARFRGVRQLDMAWVGVRRLRVCAQARQQVGEPMVEVPSPRGPRTFDVEFVCPAVVVQPASVPADSPTRRRALADEAVEIDPAAN